MLLGNLSRKAEAKSTISGEKASGGGNSIRGRNRRVILGKEPNLSSRAPGKLSDKGGTDIFVRERARTLGNQGRQGGGVSGPCENRGLQ